MQRKIIKVINLVTTALLFTFTAHTEAAIAVIVNKSVDESIISPDLVASIFLGKIGQLPNGQDIQPLDLAAGESLRKDFYKKVTHKSDSQIRAYWARLVFTGQGKAPYAVDDDSEMLEFIRENKSFIGYIDHTLVSDDVKVLLVVE